MFHGHVEIKTKTKHGRVERYGGDNTFQSDVLAGQFENMPCILQNPYNNSNWSNDPIKAMIGGLLLFQNSISVGSYYMPAGNKMIGCGAMGVENNGTPVELGSYNNSLSSRGQDGDKYQVTQYYDYSPSQANGTIGCVCLTSYAGGLGGYGNPSGAARTGNNRASIQQYHQNTSLSPRIPAENGNYYYLKINTENGTTYLDVTKNRKVSSIATVFAGANTTKRIEIVSNTAFDGWSIASRYSSPHEGSNTVGFYVDNGIIRFCPVGYYTCAPGGTFYYWEYNTNTETLERKSIVNNATETLVADYYSYHDTQASPIFTRDGNVMIKNSNQNAIYFIRLSDSVVMHKTTSFNPIEQYMGNRDYGVGQVSPGLYLVKEYNQDVMRMVDIVAGTEYKTNWGKEYQPNDFNGTGMAQILGSDKDG